MALLLHSPCGQVKKLDTSNLRANLNLSVCGLFGTDLGCGTLRTVGTTTRFTHLVCPHVLHDNIHNFCM